MRIRSVLLLPFLTSSLFAAESPDGPVFKADEIKKICKEKTSGARARKVNPGRAMVAAETAEAAKGLLGQKCMGCHAPSKADQMAGGNALEFLNPEKMCEYIAKEEIGVDCFFEEIGYRTGKDMDGRGLTMPADNPGSLSADEIRRIHMYLRSIAPPTSKQMTKDGEQKKKAGELARCCKFSKKDGQVPSDCSTSQPSTDTAPAGTASAK